MVVENLGRQPNFCLQRNRALTYWHERQFCDCCVLIEFPHLILLLAVELYGALTIWAQVFDFYAKNCVHPLRPVGAAKICVVRPGHRIVGGPRPMSPRYFGAPPPEQTAVFG